MIGLMQRLSSAGVLGINRRNGDYTLRYNDRRLYPLVDDKLRTKQLARDFGIAVPELYGYVESHGQLGRFGSLIEGHEDFVIKPARGSGGDGILVLAERAGELFFSVSGEPFTRSELCYHLSEILGGVYSLGGEQDTALIEYRVKIDPVFEAISYQGVPDIRIIILFGVPVMAMVRLPTRRSHGKANLHQGAIGAGVDLATGRTLQAVSGNAIITVHPDTRQPVAGVQIPNWKRLLGIAASCYELTGLGYQGVDLVLDRELGPLMLEVNARPGLNIQIANRQGLLSRLQKVEADLPALKQIDARVDYAMTHFGAA